MRIEDGVYLDFDDVLIKPKRSKLISRKEVELEREYTFLYSKKKWKGIPIIASNMSTVGTWEMRDSLSQYHIPTMIHKFYSYDDWKLNFIPLSAHYNLQFSSKANDSMMRFLEYIKFTIPSFGIRDEDFSFLKTLINKVDYFPNMIAFDIANGYMERFVDFIKQIRDLFQDKITIIAGNVATPEAAEALVFAGTDVVKIGIGPSKICDTRIKTGVGVPQLSSIINCSDAVHGLGAHVISDGGCKTSADISKSFGAGADFVMIGSMLAGHEESGGETIENSDGSFFKEVYGMSSEHAMKKHYGEKNKYRASEGNYEVIPYRGLVKDTIEDLLGGIRSTCTYVGAKRLKDLSKCTTFIRVNRIK